MAPSSEGRAALNHRGLSRMAQSSVVICGLAHQCALTLPRTLRRIDQLRGLFRQSAVVVFENESRDRTLKILRKWAARGEDITILSQPFPASLNLPTEHLDTGTPAFSVDRIQRMAWARNQYLDFVRENHDPAYLLVLDFDLHRLSLKGIADTFGADREWDAVFSNSRAFNRYRLWQPRVYWDTYAFKPNGDSGPQTSAQIFGSQKDLQTLEPGAPWLPVASAFGGMAIYRWQAIRPFRYQCMENADPEIQAKCEHVTLHAEMAQAGHDRLFINPSQIIYYDTMVGKLAHGGKVVVRESLKSVGLYKRRSASIKEKT